MQSRNKDRYNPETKTELFSVIQGSLIPETERASFKCLIWTANDSIVKLRVSITSNVSL